MPVLFSNEPEASKSPREKIALAMLRAAPESVNVLMQFNNDELKAGQADTPDQETHPIAYWLVTKPAGQALLVAEPELLNGISKEVLDQHVRQEKSVLDHILLLKGRLPDVLLECHPNVLLSMLFGRRIGFVVIF